MTAVEQLGVEAGGPSVLLAAERLPAGPVADVMSVPLDRLCRLAWPLLLPVSTTTTTGISAGGNRRAPAIPRVAHADPDDAQLARLIDATVAETVAAARAQKQWGTLTCHSLRAVLVERALRELRDEAAVVPITTTTNNNNTMHPSTVLLPSSTPPTPLSAATAGGTSQKGLQRVSNSSFTSEETTHVDTTPYSSERRKITSVSWVLAYVAGQQDEMWLSEKVREMVEVTALAQNEGQKQLVSTVASLSGQVQHDKRSAQVFLCILQEVLRRWNSTPDSTGESAIFCFGVVVPILNITRFTSFNDTDMITLGRLLSNVNVPPRNHDAGKEELSVAKFVTNYSLTLDMDVDSRQLVSTSIPPSPLAMPPPSPLLPPRLRSFVSEPPVFDCLRRTDYSSTHVSEPVMSTEVFLQAPQARKVTISVRRAVCCEGVQLILIPRHSVGDVIQDDHSDHDNDNDNDDENNEHSSAGVDNDKTEEGGDKIDVVDRNKHVIEPVWFEPREGETRVLNGACDCMIRYMRNTDNPTTTLLEADVRVETTLHVDGRWVVELRNTLSTLQLDIASFLIQKLKNDLVKGEIRVREETLVLFRNGLRNQPRLGESPRFVEELLKIDDATLCKRVPCRQSDVRAVRAALTLIGTFLDYCEPDQLCWESRIWMDAVKRVALASSVLGKNTDINKMVTFVLEYVEPCYLTMPQIVEGTISLLTCNISVSEIQTLLAAQRSRAEFCILALNLLLQAKNNFVPGDMFRVASLLREVVMHEGTHYLLRFQGCGELLEKEIRTLVHRLLTALFTALQRIMSLPEGERRKHGPHRFLWDADEYGPFALVTLSLIASPLDVQDVEFIQYKIVKQVEELLPNFTDFSPTASFKVSDVEEGTMLEFLRALIDDNNTIHNHLHHHHTDDNDNNETSTASQSFTGLTMTGATERGVGMWMPTERERICSTSTPFYTPASQVSSPSSDVPVSHFSPSTAAADVQLVIAPPQELMIALASEQHTSLTSAKIQSDPEGFYLFPKDGILHHADRQITLPPLSQGDTITFCFFFSPKTSSRILRLFLNSIRIAEFPAPQQRLFLLAGAMDSTSLRPNTFYITFRSENEVMTSILPMSFDNEGITDGLPTRHAISMFATLVFYYMISFCTRRAAHMRRTMTTGSTSQAISPTFANSRSNAIKNNSQSEEVWRGFVDGCCNPLRQNVESLIDSIQHLPLLSEIDNVTQRVQRNAAFFVYHRFLMDYITIVRTALRCTSSPVEMLTTLARVVCCEEVGEKERCMALTAVCSVLREPYRGFGVGAYNPAQLWECCRSLARDIFKLTYQPIFTTESTTPDMIVFSGGKRVKSALPRSEAAHAVQDTTSFASQGIPMDGSLGEVVSFSVRLQREFGFDTLGRYYYVGVASPYPMSTATTLVRHPGESREMAYLYAITDHFTDVRSNPARAELPRHAKNWMSSEESIIFGSGDVITVTVNTKLRCISFERNGLPLGTLYTNIPSMVRVVFPFVKLFNRDASAVWMYTPREIGIRARFAMREMLRHWGFELMPHLKEMITSGDVVALKVLGSDGDETCFCYRSPPRSAYKGSQNVHLVRQIGTESEVLVEGGAKSIIVPSVALELNYDVVISQDMPVGVLIEELIQVVSTLLNFTRDEKGIENVHIKNTKMFICALRLLSEVEWTNMNTVNVETQEMLLKQFIHLLSVPITIPSNGMHIVLDAWNEVMLLSDDDNLCISIPSDTKSSDTVSSTVNISENENTNNTDTTTTTTTTNTTTITSNNKKYDHHKSVYGGIYIPSERTANFCLRCPSCDQEWGSCSNEQHTAPSSLCDTLDRVLKRLGVSSPFTGFASEWFLTEEGIQVTLRVNAAGEVEGEGEERHGVFTFTGKHVSSNVVKGRCVYKCADNVPIGEDVNEEWTCEVCTFINLPDSTRCAMCTTARPGATWTCLLCGYGFNSKRSVICVTCGHQRVGGSETGPNTERKQAFCEGCRSKREYTTFHSFDSRVFCETCQRVTLWLPEENHTAVVEAVLVGAGDRMEWMIRFGNVSCIYTGLQSLSYSLESMQQAAEAASPGASDLSRYIPPLVYIPKTSNEESISSLFSSLQQQQQQLQSQQSQQSQQQQQQQQVKEHYRAVVPAIIFFCSRILCRWAPLVIPKELTKIEVLRCIRVLDESWLTHFENIPLDVARGLFYACLSLLFEGNCSEQVIKSLFFIARIVMNHHTELQKQRHYLLYALCLNTMKGCESREIREACHISLNTLLEESFGQSLNARCLQDVVTITPFVAEQQRLMVHASLRGVDVSISANVTLTSWLIEAVERMERRQCLPALFDEQSLDIFPYLVELPDTRMGEGGELIVGQVRGSVGALTSKGGRYYYEVVLPSNFNQRGKIVVMGWGTLQHEVLSSGRHVGSDIHSWGFNCQDRLRMLTGEQAITTPRPIVGGDVVGALLDLDSMMMCWSVNGEELMWVAVSTQGKGEAIYPFVSAAVDPYAVIIRLGHTQFKPEGYKDFSPFPQEEVRRESKVEPQSYEFYVQLCKFGNDIVNCGFTVDSLLETKTWSEHAQIGMQQYPLLCIEAEKSLDRLRPYFQHLRVINALAVSVAKSHDIFRNSPYLLRSYQKTRQLLFFTARWAIVERQIDRRLIRSNTRRQHSVVIDLNRAKAMMEGSTTLDFLTLFNGSITGQLFRQTKDADIYLDAVMFGITLTGEVADDAGGVTRSMVTMMCDELSYRDDEDGRRSEPLLPFFKLTNHSTIVNVVPNMDFYHDYPEHRQIFLQFFTWLGKLLGNATLSGYLMFSLTLPRLVWKFLTFDEITIEDYYSDIDDTVRGAINDDEFLLNDEFFYAIPGIERQDESVTETMVMLRSNRVLPIITPARSSVDLYSTVATDEHEETVEVEWRRKEAERALTHQYDELLFAMRSGITFVIPQHSLQLIRWDDLQQRVCGTPGATAEDVIASLDCSLISDELRQMLMDVIRGWTSRQHSQFLLFCTGQRRIPLREKVQVSCGDNPNAIPTAHTCSPISLLLQPYASASILREKLEVCLRHMYEFGFA
ncbi:uncharacterized protein TM35_000021360 [Trypanosoma theileri]|uniref:RanBP2-type domain-containing protein n=1 Tax=Trypanosoma theileri TaxID=67003 RepID=A0A1X0P8N8_9TRYP|nr:uncharacterized protein TM35_000021360 [Trypanosoma theileri]ORC92810.1 hypothetical protein TM35_000021360 [Trypanosoma theileri]